MTWTPAAGVTGYQVHRSAQPYFTPTVSYAAGATSPWTDPDSKVGKTQVNYTYCCAAGLHEPSSPRVAEFDFPLTPGQ